MKTRKMNGILLPGFAGYVTLALVVIASVMFVTRSNYIVHAAAGTPDAPTVLFTENFQNTSNYNRVLLTSYTGSSGMTYTANGAWLTNCNGEILAFNTPDSEFENSNCSGGNGGAGSGTNLTGAFDQVRRMAYAMGQLNNINDPATNKALTAYTDYGNLYADPGADLVQLQTQNFISLPAGSRRFVISNVDVAAVNCTFSGTDQAQLVFYLLDGSNTRRINQDPINVCTDPTAVQYTPPSLNTNGAGSTSSGPVWTARMLTDRSLLTQTDSVGLQMVNEQASGYGNDNALDNIQFADASPKLDKSFTPEVVDVGSHSRMTFTVTNTSDLLAKVGWSFVDVLPEQLLVSEEPNIETDCVSGAITVSEDKEQITYAGDLMAGQASCTLSIDVTSATAGTYTNGADNLHDVVGLRLPNDATLTFAPAAPRSGAGKTVNSLYMASAISAMLVGLVATKKYILKK